jgi:tripartite ATP-independent transporter DctP family solute receptor
MRIIFIMMISFIIFNSCGQKSNVVTLKLAHGLAITHPVHKAMEFIKDRTFSKSDSTLIIEIYPNEQLGNEKECIEKVQMSAIAMTKVSSSMLENFSQEYKVFALPYLFENQDHKWNVLNGPIGKKILISGEKHRLKGLIYFDAGERSFYTAEKPIIHPDDLKGLKIRTQQSPMAMKMIEALGGSPTPISWGELYTSLQQGVVDGAENNEPSLYTSNHYEVCKHYSLDEHTSVPDVIVINTLIWNKLSEKHKAVLQEAAEAAVPYQRKLWAEFVKECMDKMTASGLKVYHPEKKPFKERSMALWKEFDNTIIGDLATQIQKTQ